MNRLVSLKQTFKPFRMAQYSFSEEGVFEQLNKLLAPSVKVHMCSPFGDIFGAENFYKEVLQTLFVAMPDLERRDYIVLSGSTEKDHEWIGCCGVYLGTFTNPFININPTGHLAHMRFHEFYRFEDRKIVEIQAIWDIPELMMQAKAWPMSPSLGREWCVTGPASMDGLSEENQDIEKSKASLEHVMSMLNSMNRHPMEGGPELMKMDHYWHPRMNWYGPSGIGTARGVQAFRDWHQIPFLNAMPDRGQSTKYIERDGSVGNMSNHLFGDGDYVACTGWPNMSQTLSHDGWMGIPPINKKVTLRSLDFWRLEAGLIRENWVLVDLLNVYNQIGVNVFARLAEFNKIRKISNG